MKSYRESDKCLPGGTGRGLQRTKRCKGEISLLVDPLENLSLPNVIRTSSEVLLPVSGLPEPEAIHIFAVTTHGCIAVRSTVQIQGHELVKIGSNDLVRIDEDDLLEIHREQHIQEQNLVTPDDPLLLCGHAEP